MNFHSFWRTLLLLVMFTAGVTASAQSMLNQTTYYFPQYSSKNVTWTYGDGSVFRGTASYMDQQCTAINGTLNFPNGDMYVGTLDPSTRMMRQGVLTVKAEGKAYNVTYQNGNLVSKTPYTANYSSGAGGIYVPSSGSYGGYSESSSGSSSRTPKTCTLCHGNLRCSLCNGRGEYMPSISVGHYVKCGRCNGTGICQSCKGKGTW